MAFTSISALVAGAEVTAGLVLGAIAEVGLAMTVVGGVTGNKDLMKIGGAMSLIGGVGGMINGAVNGAAGAAAGGADAATSAAWSTGAEGLGQDVLSNVGGAAADVGTQAISSSVPAVGDLATSSLAPADMSIASQMTGSQMPAAASEAATSGATAAVDLPGPAGVEAPTGPAGAQGPSTPFEMNPTDSRLAAGTQSAPMSSGSFFDRFSGWANKNKALFQGGMQLLGGAMQGANQSAMWNEKMALEKQRLQQSSYGSQIGNFAPRAGIIAGAR